jgi:hypothetical protein
MNNDTFMAHISNIPPLESIRPAPLSEHPTSDMIVPASAAVAGQGIIGFVEGISRQAREDVLDTFTYATLAADKRHDVVSQNGAWYKVFREVMTRALHWTPQDVAYTSYSSRERVLSMDKIGLDLLASSLAAAGATAATGGAASPLVLQVAGDAVKALKDNPGPLRLFDGRTKKPNGARFMVGGCRESQDGVIVLAVGAVEMKTRITTGHVLFVNWNSVSLDLQRSADVFVFHQSLYALRRDRVRAALSSSADAAFLDFPI